MENMNYLFEMQQIEEMQKATGRFKTALGKEGKPQCERITKIAPDKVEVYAERVPRSAKEITTITIYRKSEPERRVDLSRIEALRLIGELKEALKL
jgi:hypothetical protein